MTSLKNALIVFAIAFALGTTAYVADAGCGECGSKKEHKHDLGDEEGKVACVKCTHAKVCESEDCADEAHKAECTCPAKEEEKADEAA